MIIISALLIAKDYFYLKYRALNCFAAYLGWEQISKKSANMLFVLDISFLFASVTDFYLLLKRNLVSDD